VCWSCVICTHSCVLNYLDYFYGSCSDESCFYVCPCLVIQCFLQQMGGSIKVVCQWGSCFNTLGDYFEAPSHVVCMALEGFHFMKEINLD
jgi:hypothetical protein